MHAAKLLCAYIGLFWLEPNKPTQVSIETDLFWTYQSIEELKTSCACEVSLHRDFTALRVSVDLALPAFLKREKACGIVGVNAKQTKGWVFQSKNCENFASVPGVYPVMTLKSYLADKAEVAF